MTNFKVEKIDGGRKITQGNMTDEQYNKEMEYFEKSKDMSIEDSANFALEKLEEEKRARKKYDAMTKEWIKNSKNMSREQKDIFVEEYTRLRNTYNFAKGGATMQQQMKLFDEGGLEQDGGTIDPISGNEVPVGSSQEEVRDDIPAQLSEGEFVFPADVVRFIGLSKLMNLRQQAKAGLKRMEAMGQMGNSEEAVLPDDIPFNMDDLDLEDDSIPAYQGGSIQSFANGGSPYASDINVQGGQMFEQQEFNPLGMKRPPIQEGLPEYRPMPMPIDDYVSPIQDNTPVDAPTDPLPPFDVFIPPVADEYREYINDEGIIINVPFFRGNILPGYTVPKGFRPKQAEPADNISDDVISDIAEPDEDSERQDKQIEEDNKRREESYSNTVQKVMDENPNFTFQEVMDYIKSGKSTINIFGKEMKVPGFFFNEKDLTNAYNRNLTGEYYRDELDTDYSFMDDPEKRRGVSIGPEADKRRALAEAKQAAQEKAEAEAAAYQKSRLIAKQKAEEAFAEKVAEDKRQAKIKEDAIKEAEKQSKIKSAAQAIADRKKKAAEREAAAEANRKRLADEAAQKRREQDKSEREDQDRRDREAAREAEKEQTRAQKEKYTRDETFEKKTGYRRAKGGIIERPKKKKMKRGGLASKK
jgi:hypothetical protein